jgi:hypothetical protein
MTMGDPNDRRRRARNDKRRRAQNDTMGYCSLLKMTAKQGIIAEDEGKKDERCK